MIALSKPVSLVTMAVFYAPSCTAMQRATSTWDEMVKYAMGKPKYNIDQWVCDKCSAVNTGEVIDMAGNIKREPCVACTPPKDDIRCRENRVKRPNQHLHDDPTQTFSQARTQRRRRRSVGKPEKLKLVRFDNPKLLEARVKDEVERFQEDLKKDDELRNIAKSIRSDLRTEFPELLSDPVDDEQEMKTDAGTGADENAPPANDDTVEQKDDTNDEKDAEAPVVEPKAGAGENNDADAGHGRRRVSAEARRIAANLQRLQRRGYPLFGYCGLCCLGAGIVAVWGNCTTCCEDDGWCSGISTLFTCLDCSAACAKCGSWVCCLIEGVGTCFEKCKECWNAIGTCCSDCCADCDCGDCGDLPGDCIIN